jgi:hypothetical protein
MLYPVIFILLAALILILAIFNIRSSLLLEYVRKDGNDNLVLSIFGLKGLFKYKFEIPILEMSPEGIKVKKLKKKGKREKEKEEEDETVSIKELIAGLIKKYKTYKLIMNYFLDRLRVEKFELDIVAGMGDAFYTGVLTGYIWAAAGILDSLLTNRFNSFKKRINIQPNFLKKDFTIDLYCIFSIKVVHIIVVGFIFGLNNLKKKLRTGGGKSGSASNRRINENCNGKY